MRPISTEPHDARNHLVGSQPLSNTVSVAPALGTHQAVVSAWHETRSWTGFAIKPRNSPDYVSEFLREDGEEKTGTAPLGEEEAGCWTLVE